MITIASKRNLLEIGNLCGRIYRKVSGAPMCFIHRKTTAKYIIIKFFVDHLTITQLDELSAQIKADSLYGDRFVKAINTHRVGREGPEQMLLIRFTR